MGSNRKSFSCRNAANNQRECQHSPGRVKAKADTARYQWCAAVNNHGGYGRWGYDEITEMSTAQTMLDTAIQNLYADGPVTGLRDVEEVGV